MPVVGVGGSVLTASATAIAPLGPMSMTCPSLKVVVIGDEGLKA